jgi:hypothetical protein
MVHKELICKIIDYSISKCSRHRTGRLSCPNVIKRALDDFASRTHEDTREHMEWYTSDGMMVFKKTGDAMSVEWDVEDEYNVIDDEYFDLYAVHNHPDTFLIDGTVYNTQMIPTLLSYEDINNLWTVHEYSDYSSGEEIEVPVTLFKSITADCGNGSRMTLSRIGGDGMDNSILHPTEKMVDTFNDAYDRLVDNWKRFTNAYKDEVNNHMSEWCMMKLNTLKDSNGVNGRWTPSDYENERRRYGKRFSQEVFNEYIMDSINEFKDIGFDLSTEWTT